MSMYGTRDAAQNWAEEYSATLLKDGYERGIANPCLFFGKKENCSIMVHGDDFVAVGSESATTKLRLTLEKAYKIKSEILGTSSNDLKEIRVLNRVVKCNDRGYTLEATQGMPRLPYEISGSATQSRANFLGRRKSRRSLEEDLQEQETTP